MKNILIVLAGPTCVGKTGVSISIAGHFGCEIISADSRQFYREMKIGTAVPSEAVSVEPAPLTNSWVYPCPPPTGGNYCTCPPQI